jgi:hypothetical protein
MNVLIPKLKVFLRIEIKFLFYFRAESNVLEQRVVVEPV